MSWFKTYSLRSLFRQPAPKNATTNDGYLPYGHHDNFPLEWSNDIQNSPTASSCLGTLQDFIEGQKFSDDNLMKRVVNPKGETLWQIHQQSSDSWGEFEGFAWLIRFNALGSITEIEFLPFENCRLGKPDSKGYISKIYYNPFFGTDDYRMSDKQQTTIYDVFNPKFVTVQISEQKAKFKGQIFYCATTTSLSRFYPRPKPISAKKWMKIEAGISDYHEDKIDNGFLNDYILIMKGNPNEPSTNPEFEGEDKPVTVGQEFDRVMENNFMGKGQHANVMVQWVNNADEKPEIVPIPSSANGDLFITLDNQATKKITVAWKVPSILANISEGVSLGGDGNQVRVSVKLMQQRVIKEQKILTDSYEKILKLCVQPYNEEITIVSYNPYPELEVLDDKVWNAMTTEEKRQWIKDNTDITLIEETAVEDPIEPIVQPTQNFTNAVPVSFPDNVRSKVKKAIEYGDKMGIKCGGKPGLEVANSIANNQNMGLRQLKRIYNYLKKNEKYANSPFNEGCDVILYNRWGGKEMYDFLDVKLKDFEQWLNKTN